MYQPMRVWSDDPEGDEWWDRFEMAIRRRREEREREWVSPRMRMYLFENMRYAVRRHPLDITSESTTTRPENVLNLHARIAMITSTTIKNYWVIQAEEIGRVFSAHVCSTKLSHAKHILLEYIQTPDFLSLRLPETCHSCRCINVSLQGLATSLEMVFQCLPQNMLEIDFNRQMVCVGLAGNSKPTSPTVAYINTRDEFPFSMELSKIWEIVNHSYIRGGILESRLNVSPKFLRGGLLMLARVHGRIRGLPIRTMGKSQWKRPMQLPVEYIFGTMESIEW